MSYYTYDQTLCHNPTHSTRTQYTLIHCIIMNDTNYVFSINYEKSLQYWAEIPPTVDGVLGGFGFISNADIEGSELFLKSLLSSDNPPSTNTALDCGAGIGRITKQLLLPHFDLVDVVEPDEKFVNSIKEYVGELCSKLGTLHKIGLQEFIPSRKYDVIWNQWVLGYLTDEDLKAYLIRCRDSLSASGIIVVKENVTSSGKIEKDSTDSSVTRTYKQYIRIFKICHLKRIKQCKQANFPNGIYPVYMFALVPNLKELERSITKTNSTLKNPCNVPENIIGL